MIAIILGLVINILLIFLIYPKFIQLLIENYNSYHNIFVGLLIILTVTTPYLTHHIYNFVLNRPMNIPLTLKWNGTPYIHKYNNSSSRNTATSPSYSFLSYNINHRR